MAKKIPEGPKGAGLRALKAEAPEVTSKMGFAKNGGLSMDIQKIKKMRLGGQTIEDSTKTIDIPMPMTKPKRIDAPSPMPTVMQQNKMNKSKIQRLKNLRNVSGQGAPKSKPKK